MSVAESLPGGSPFGDVPGVGDVLGVGELDGAFGLVVAGLGVLPVRDAVARCQRYRGLLDAVEAVKLAEIVGADGDTKVASRAAGRGGKTSKREARRRGRRAAVVAKNKALADKMASGDMSGEQVDTIADAAAKSDGAAAVDDELIDAVAKASADQGRKLADEWLTARADADSTQTEHDRQRRLRRANKYTNKDGLGVINVEGDQVTIDAIWAEIIIEANRLYLHDGGRDLNSQFHPRTNSQRLYDALADLVLGTDPTTTATVPTVDTGTAAKPAAKTATATAQSNRTGNDTATTNNATDDTVTSDTISTDTISTDNHDAAAAAAAARSANRDSPTGNPQNATNRARRTTRARRLPTVVVTVNIDKLTGINPSLTAEQIGIGPIADTVLATYLQNCNLIGALFNNKGEPLWLGRNARHATLGQRLALAIRDKGCVLCGTDWRTCHAHHNTPYNAPAKGKTDTNDMAYVCGDCHHQLHHHNQTLYQEPGTGHWELRPAAPTETPPTHTKNRPNNQRRNPRHEPPQTT